METRMRERIQLRIYRLRHWETRENDPIKRARILGGIKELQKLLEAMR